jgi:3-oxoacyl-[acyl-carrier protein] reductase
MNFAGHTAKAEEVVAKIKAAGGQAISVQADVSNIANVERLFKESMDAFGELV